MVLQRGDTAYIKIARQEFKGIDQVHIRLWSCWDPKKKKATDKFYPTKKGVTFNREELDSVITELQGLKTSFEVDEFEEG